ncbi:putative membrane protein [Alteromonas macleodii]|uniref:Membrane protein n=1 Tax=Alteromonas macleodii TaxID=28108 RepID=A0AB36FN29_ALTMA|nr:putative membrane protein [Alteromonas macleodii]OES24774.1 putative membrane protein [Alteromonas macleodii]OES25052.1 putative membrane protein [Alteromonas macleodii]OES39095.1 putative membrane protein [Alteromonas macleodii]
MTGLAKTFFVLSNAFGTVPVVSIALVSVVALLWINRDIFKG